MHVYVCIYIYIYICTCACMCVYIYIYVHIHVFMCLLSPAEVKDIRHAAPSRSAPQEQATFGASPQSLSLLTVYHYYE